MSCDTNNNFDIAVELNNEQLNLFIASAIESTSQLISITDYRNRFVFVNRAFLRMYGYTREEVIGKKPVMLRPKRSQEPSIDDLLEETRKAEWHGELLNVRKDGTEFPILLTTSVIRNNDGNIAGYIGIAEDITERKRAEEALIESELRFRTAVEMAPDAIFIADVAGAILEVNEAACTQFGYTRQKMLSHQVSDIMPDTFAVTVSKRSQKKERTNHPYESYHTRPDGTNVPVELNMKEIIFNGQPAMLGIARDITERKRVEGKLRIFTRQIIEAQENERSRVARELHDSVIQLLSAAKHKLAAASEKISRDTGTSWSDLFESKDLLEKAIRETRNISHGLKPSVLEDLGLIPAIRSLCEATTDRGGLVTDFRSSSSYKRLSHEIELVIYRIIQEALGNIIKHSRATKAEVIIIFSKVSVQAVVKDNGIGFDRNTIAKKRTIVSGCGLENMKERAAAVAGTLEIHSSEKEGTEVIVNIPIVET